MTEQLWLSCEDPKAMRDLLQERGLETEAKLRAWVWSCRLSHRDRDKWGDLVGASLAAGSWSSSDFYSKSPTLAYRCHLIREIWGNPFRPLMVMHKGNSYFHEVGTVLFNGEWLTPEVIAMARLIHDTQDWGLMPIFADLLEDAGCDNEDVLHHARGEERCYPCRIEIINFDAEGKLVDVNVVPPHPGCVDCKGTGWIPARAPHVKGCWLLSLITGDE